MLIFDGYGSHVTQDFIKYCQEHRIRPFQLLPHSTHLLQPLDVGVFQKFKHEFKELIREKVFLRAREINKADFFALFNKFSAKTFKPKLCKSAFQKTGLIPFDPSIILSKIKEYGSIQEVQREETSSSDKNSEPAFATLPSL